jgi:hypothetical protein
MSAQKGLLGRGGVEREMTQVVAFATFAHISSEDLQTTETTQVPDEKWTAARQQRDWGTCLCQTTVSRCMMQMFACMSMRAAALTRKLHNERLSQAFVHARQRKGVA